jgi:hypothetical protein
VTGKGTNTREHELLAFERRIQSLFDEAASDRDVMKRNEERVHRAIDQGPVRPRRWKSVAGALAIATAGLAIALLTAAVHSRLTQPSSPASTTKTKAILRSSVATEAPLGSCRLPVTTDAERGFYSHGFVDFPTGAYVADQSSGGRSRIYDRQLERWIPFSSPFAAQWPSPDGRTLAYETAFGRLSLNGDGGDIHLVNLASGQDHVIWSNRVDRAYLAGYSEAGIVFFVVSAESGTADTAAIGTWVINPADGSLKMLSSSDESVIGVAGRWAWWLDEVAWQLFRVDLQTGAKELWMNVLQFRAQNNYNGGIVLIGFDQQRNPVIRIGSRDPGTAYTVFVLTAPNQRRVIYAGHQGDATDFDPTGAVSDGQGIWFGNFDNSAIWLLRDSTLTRVPVHGLPHEAAAMAVVGPCS